MRLHASAEKLGGLKRLDAPAGAAAKAVQQVVGQGGLKDLLSGTALGHPLHPLLTDIPIGTLASATLLDLLGRERGEHAADVLVGLGLLSALPTAAAGAADWSDSYGPDQRVGAVHAIANVIGPAQARPVGEGADRCGRRAAPCGGDHAADAQLDLRQGSERSSHHPAPTDDPAPPRKDAVHPAPPSKKPPRAGANRDMIELTLLALLNRLTNWGLAPLIAARAVAADADALHRFLSDPANQVRLLGDHPRGITARVRPTASRRVISVELLRGERTVLRATWILSAGRGITDVDLALQFETRGLATRVALVLGGRRWLARRIDATLARLAQICARAAEEAVPVSAPTPAPAAAGRARTTRSTRNAHRAGTHPRRRSEVA